MRRRGRGSGPCHFGRLRAAVAIIGVVVLTGIAGCGSSNPTLVLYNGQHAQLTASLVQAFEAQTGIQVAVRTGDGVVLADQILQEGRSTPADLYFTENSPELMLLEQKGLLAPLPPSITTGVPAADSSPQGDWVGAALRVSALAVNTGLLGNQPLPASILDLAGPGWKGKVALAPTDSDFLPLVGAVIAEYGAPRAELWLRGLRANGELFQDDEAVAAAVNAGQVAVGIINQYYWYRLRLEVGASRMASSLYYFPHHDVGSMVNVSGISILSASNHRALAERFVAFVVSAEGQRILAAGDDFEYPVLPSVPAHAGMPPLASIAGVRINVVTLGDDLPASRLVQLVGLT